MNYSTYNDVYSTFDNNRNCSCTRDNYNLNSTCSCNNYSKPQNTCSCKQNMMYQNYNSYYPYYNNYNRAYENGRFIGPGAGGFILPFALGFASAPLFFRPRPYYQQFGPRPPYPYY